MTTVIVDQPEEGVTRVTLHRPDRLNAMNAELIGDLHDALADIAVDRTCRVVVLTGHGRGFCAGLDLGGYGDPLGVDGLGQVETTFATQTQIAALVPRLRSLPQPVIAAVNGAAEAAGSRSRWRATSASRGPQRASTWHSCASVSRAATSV